MAVRRERKSKAKTATLTERVLRGLIAEIHRGGLKPGTRLDEVGISVRYGVSRTPVREALQHIVAAGLATRRPHCGVFVREERVAPALGELRVALCELHLACARAACVRAPGRAPTDWAPTDWAPGDCSLSDCLRRLREGAGNRYLAEAAETVWAEALRYLPDAIEAPSPDPPVFSGAADCESVIRRRLDQAWAAVEAGGGAGPDPRIRSARAPRRPGRPPRPRSS